MKVNRKLIITINIADDSNPDKVNYPVDIQLEFDPPVEKGEYSSCLSILNDFLMNTGLLSNIQPLPTQLIQ